MASRVCTPSVQVNSRLLSDELYGISSADPLTYAAVCVLMLAVTLAACYLPTRRAMRTDPLSALRHY